jgi:hypothetical protein
MRFRIESVLRPHHPTWRRRPWISIAILAGPSRDSSLPQQRRRIGPVRAKKFRNSAYIFRHIPLSMREDTHRLTLYDKHPIDGHQVGRPGSLRSTKLARRSRFAGESRGSHLLANDRPGSLAFVDYVRPWLAGAATAPHTTSGHIVCKCASSSKVRRFFQNVRNFRRLLARLVIGPSGNRRALPL